MHLTKSQKLVYDMEKFVGGGTISIICGSMLSAGSKTIEEIQKAVNEIYCINEGLRTRIVENETGVHQEISPYYKRDYSGLRQKKNWIPTRRDMQRFRWICMGNYARQRLSFCPINTVYL